jgi:hypothetical protein
MELDFPRHAFKSPGAIRIPEGSYDAELGEDQEAFDKLIKAGWSQTILGAVEAVEVGKAPKADKPPKAS